jgi:hypothetical protein
VIRSATILWRRLDRIGTESARLELRRLGATLSGTAVFEHEGAPVVLGYRIEVDRRWRTRVATVQGRVGERRIERAIEAAAAPAVGWRVDGRRVPAVDGCVDLDLNFSPSTNLLPIRRLSLAIGAEATVRSAWLRFPSFVLEPLEQRYRRTGERTWFYRSTTGFEATLEVDAAGFVTRYPGLAEAVPPV